VTIGTNKYLFVKKLTNSVPNQVKLGSKLSGSLSNLISAINGSVGGGTNYSSSTRSNAQVMASSLVSNRFVNVTARVAGTAANGILTTNKAVNLTWNGHLTLFGGSNAVAAITNISSKFAGYDSMVNSGLISDQGSTIDAAYFQNSGTVSNGVGNFVLRSKDALFTNGSIIADGDVSIITGTLITSNLSIVAGRSLVIRATNYLNDTGVPNGNYWDVRAASGVGINLTVQPSNGGSLLGTTVSVYAPTNKVVANTWCGSNLGAVPGGYTNNQALGRLILNGLGAVPFGGVFKFSGVSSNSALYVDLLELEGSATNRSASGDLSSLSINTNIVIYYSKALQAGNDVSSDIDHKNNDRLRWVSSYGGFFSSAPALPFFGSASVASHSPIASISARMLPSGGGLKLSVLGGNQQMEIQFSTNLVDWHTIKTGMPPFEHTDESISEYRSKFYRVVPSQ